MSCNNGDIQDEVDQSLSVVDPEVYGLIELERCRQQAGLEMIASENFTSVAVRQCMGSCLANKYSEGLPGRRYYGGNEHIDELERLTQRRCLEAFGLSSDEWGVNVQPYSGSPANFAVYTGLVGPHSRIMGLDLPDGGHLTHGFFTAKKKISATSIFFESMPYKVDPDSGLIDYVALSKDAVLFKPRLIIAGISCYSRNLDYSKFREICDSNQSILMADMAHIAGLVAARVVPSPFEFCDVVTSTTHKTLRGPRAGIIFYRKGKRADGTSYDFETKINEAVFPGLQGGPHNHAIAGIAVAMKMAMSPQFFQYQDQVLKNSRQLASSLIDLGYVVVTGGTDNHIVHLNVSKKGLSGAKAEFILECVSISVNKNTVPGDKSALNPSGIRLGTPPLTTRGFREADIKMVSNFIHQAFNLGLAIQSKCGSKLVDWRRGCNEDSGFAKQILSLKKEVESFAMKYPIPGNTTLIKLV